MAKSSNSYWLKSEGTLLVNHNVIRLIISTDFIKYYKTFVDKEYKIFSNTPAHGAHITLWNPKIHGSLDAKKAKFLKDFYKGNKISFEYDPYIIEGGYNKNFQNFFMKVRSITLGGICNILGNDQKDRLHITIANTKGGVKPYIWFKKP